MVHICWVLPGLLATLSSRISHLQPFGSVEQQRSRPVCRRSRRGVFLPPYHLRRLRINMNARPPSMMTTAAMPIMLFISISEYPLPKRKTPIIRAAFQIIGVCKNGGNNQRRLGIELSRRSLFCFVFNCQIHAIYPISLRSISSMGSVCRPSEISLFRRTRRLSHISRNSAALTSMTTFFSCLNICKTSFHAHYRNIEKGLQMCKRYVSDLPKQVTGAMITCSKSPSHRRRRYGRWRPP